VAPAPLPGSPWLSGIMGFRDCSGQSVRGDAGPLEMLEAFLHLGEVVEIALAFLWPACAWMLDLRSCRDLPQTECREQRREERVCVPGVTQAMELMMNCHNH